MTPPVAASSTGRPVLLATLLLFLPALAPAGVSDRRVQVPVEEIRLANGIQLLLVDRAESTTVAAGWMVRAGSADDPPQQTGISHLIEHLMFKGTESIGTRNIDRESEILDRIDRVWKERRSIRGRQADASGKKRKRLARQAETLSRELESLQNQARELTYLGEFSLLYSEQGGTGLDANTHQDLTLYYVTLPADKLELWFWLESDRLLHSVFREFYQEVEVIHEERRLRIESTPTGPADEELRTLFWGDHPYAWNPMGHADHLSALARTDAIDFFNHNYRSDNLTLALVGPIDTTEVSRWANRYFGRLPAVDRQGPPIDLPGANAFEARRLEATCECPPQVHILYPATRFGDSDGYALQLLSAIMNGRTGRLYRDLVLDRQIAFAAYTQQIPRKRAGLFSFHAESKGAVDPEVLIDAWDRQLRQLIAEPPSPREVDRARNRMTADALRSLRQPIGLLKQLLIYEGLGDWQYLNHWASRIGEVTPGEVVEVATRHLVPARRTIAIYRRPGRTTSSGIPSRTGEPPAREAP